MQAERFVQPSGQLMQQTTPNGIAYLAFIPAPLPPQLELDLPLVNALSDADRALGQLAGLGSTIANPHLLIQPFVSREAVLSSRIEGTRTGIDDLYAYRAQLALPGMEAAAIHDAQEVVNYITALEYGIQRQVELPLSIRLLRELHERLMYGVRGQDRCPGEFRSTQNYIAGWGLGLQEARFVPPPPQEMQQALYDLERYIHEPLNVPPLVKIALIHYQFEAIHPFEDGNGRIGRLLIPLLLVDWQLLPAPLLYLSAYFEQDRQEYYDLLLAVSERSAWHDWLLFFVRGVAEQARDATHRARQLQALEETWRDELRAAYPKTANVVRLMEHLFVEPVISVRTAQHVLGLSYTAANKHVSALAMHGILQQLGDKSYDRLFVCRQILDVLKLRDPN